jgi:hypothetical protein
MNRRFKEVLFEYFQGFASTLKAAIASILTTFMHVNELFLASFMRQGDLVVQVLRQLPSVIADLYDFIGDFLLWVVTIGRRGVGFVISAIALLPLVLYGIAIARNLELLTFVPAEYRGLVGLTLISLYFTLLLIVVSLSVYSSRKRMRAYELEILRAQEGKLFTEIDDGLDELLSREVYHDR